MSIGHMITRRMVLAAALAVPFSTAVAAEAHHYVKTELVYGGQSPMQRLDFYRPVMGSSPFPVVVWKPAKVSQLDRLQWRRGERGPEQCALPAVHFSEGEYNPRSRQCAL